MLEGFDVGLEMSGNATAAFRDMLDNMAHGGKIAMLGIPEKETAIDWNTVIFNMLNLKGIYGREMYETWYKMTVMLQSGLDISPIITHRYPYQEFQKGFDATDVRRLRQGGDDLERGVVAVSHPGHARRIRQGSNPFSRSTPARPFVLVRPHRQDNSCRIVAHTTAIWSSVVTPIEHRLQIDFHRTVTGEKRDGDRRQALGQREGVDVILMIEVVERMNTDMVIERRSFLA